MSLKVKAARGSMAMGLANFAVRPVAMLLGIVLVRLLSPEDFGSFALAMILFGTANLFSDLGMRGAVIQSQDDIKKVAFYAFLIVMGASGVIYGLTFVLAAPIATLLGGTAKIVPIIRLLGLVVVLDGLWVIPHSILSRNLSFNKLAWVKSVPDISSTVISVICALLGMGVYSLVVGALAAEGLRAVMCFYFEKEREWLKPKPIDTQIVRNLFSFGIPTMGGGILRYFSENWDDWFVGRTLGTAALGYYTKAYDVTSRLTFMFGNMVFGNVLQPTYAKIQNEADRLQRAYLKSTNLVMLTMVPISMGLAVLAHTIVLVLFGEKWLPMVLAWQIFSLYALTRPISANSSPLFLATGNPRLNVNAVILLIAVMVPLILLLIGPYGIAGVALAVSVSQLVGMLFNVYQVNKLLPGSAAKTLTTNAPILLAGVVMMICVQLLKAPVFNLTNGENALALGLLVGAGAVVFIGTMFLLQRRQMAEYMELADEATGIRTRLSKLSARRHRAGSSSSTPS